MLILSRKKSESIRIMLDGKEVVLTVLSQNPASVRLGFDAPQEVKILRSELKEKGKDDGDD